MKSIIITLIAAALMLTAFAGTANAQRAASLDELMRLVEQGRASEAREAREREARFVAQKSEQERLLRDAKAKRTSEEGRAATLETNFENNETSIVEQTETLNKRLGSLKELFGVLQQVASDTQVQFDNSLVSAQYPNRGEFLAKLAAKMGTSTQLASIEEIEQLRTELLREMTESGKVARFQGQVYSSTGEQETTEVIRIGAFNLVSDGKYVNYQTATGNMSVFPRQPQASRYTDSAAAITNSTDGLVTFGLDPTRGQILALEVDKPDLQERVMQGGVVGYVIIGLGLLGLAIAFERMVMLGIAGSKVKSQLKSDQPSSKNALGRILLVAEEHKAADTETLELKLSEAIFKETPSLGKRLLFLKIISVVAPLLGLLGTVTGMIVTFQAITLFGTGDPKLMAGGISQALVTTVLGLVVAIPTVLLHTLVSGRSKGILHVLQEQSAGIIAERAESRSRA